MTQTLHNQSSITHALCCAVGAASVAVTRPNLFLQFGYSLEGAGVRLDVRFVRRGGLLAARDKRQMKHVGGPRTGVHVCIREETVR